MIIWRFSRHLGLDGQGGLVASGRWHTRGHRILYCAPNPASALLEVLAHGAVRTPEALEGFRFLKIELPDDISIERVADGLLPADWATQLEVTRAWGDRWLSDGLHPVLLVPSVLVPETWNVLCNPLHRQARELASLAEIGFPLDSRLFCAA